jgi:hypothetical protein
VNTPRKKNPYTYFPDINGNFFIQTANATNPQIEADYSWVYFALNTSKLLDKNIHIVGMFNNYSVSEEYKMEFDEKTGLYEKAILLKQGFTNYQYVITDKNGNIDYENAIDGNFYQTEIGRGAARTQYSTTQRLKGW